MSAKDPLHIRLRSFGVKNILVRNCLAEFVGTFLLVFIGTCIVAQFHLGREKSTEWLGVNIGWGFALMLSVQATANLSGGHLNPAVSFLFCTFGALPYSWLLPYSISQTAGAFFGSMIMYFYYGDAFNQFDGGARALLGVNGSGVAFCSYPSHLVNSPITPYFDQIIGTALLCYFVCVIIDERNQIPKVVHPLFFCFILIMIGCGFGQYLGYPINPARDFGPRLFSYFIYGSSVFSSPYPGYFLAPLFAPFIGSLLGGWSYHLTIGMHIPCEKKELEITLNEEEMKKFVA